MGKREPALEKAAARDAERQRKREAVLMAAVQMFNERGYRNTSLDDVAARLDVTKPVIYHYLGSKEQVLLGCLAHGLEDLRTAADEAGQGAGRAVERLRHFLERYVLIITSAFGRCVILTSDDELSPDGRIHFRAMKREVDTAIRALLAAGVQDGSLQATDIRLTAFTLASAVNGVARWYRPEGELSAMEVATGLVDILLAGVRPRPKI